MSERVGRVVRAPRGARRIARAVRESLPQGRLLQERAWRRRHRGIVALLYAHALGLSLYGAFSGFSPLRCGIDGGVLAAFALAANLPALGRRARSLAGAVGLVVASSLLVDLSGGAPEAHFHFFVVINVLMLYQDWAPLLVSIAYVALEHGVVGVLAPNSVYDHPAAIAHPWKWAVAHAAFVIAASVANIISWRENEKLLRDPLTGLAGRTIFNDRLALALARLRRERGVVAVLYLDLDRFKQINDSRGHAAGDELLANVGARLKDALRPDDTVARLGGDEFAVICPGVFGEQHATAIAERLRISLAQPFPLGAGSETTTASIGVAVASRPDVCVEALTRAADAAMYRAKAAGGDRTVLHGDETAAAPPQRARPAAAPTGALLPGRAAAPPRAGLLS